MTDSQNKLIKEYCEITGRPIATLSVSEFLEFYKCNNDYFVNSTDSHNNNSFIPSQKLENKAESQIIITEPQSMKKHTPQKTSNNTLQLLQSIKG